MVCIKHHLFPIQTHIYILSGDRLKVIGYSELDTDALQAVPQDHTCLLYTSIGEKTSLNWALTGYGHSW